MSHHCYFPRFVTLVLAVAIVLQCGCSQTTEQDTRPKRSRTTGDGSAARSSRVVPELSEDPRNRPAVGLKASDYLTQCLSEEELADGWVRLFDNLTLLGWFQVGDAFWRVEDGTIKVDRGEPSFLCTSVQFSDYELKVDFRCEANTNSGVFLRSTVSPQDTATECFELNIAPPDNPFPTGSFVKRKKVEPESLGEFDPTEWHTFRVRLEGPQAKVWLDEKLILEYEDDSNLKRGFICLQRNAGPVQFRNILLRPLGGRALDTGETWEKDWKKQEKTGEMLNVTGSTEGLSLRGGLGQVETTEQWGDFVLQAKYQLANPDVNSGIFFRCIPGNLLDGYECQLNHSLQDGDPLRPADCGAGGIFRRGKEAEARVVVGDGTKPTYLTIVAEGAQFATWVNGLQVVDFADSRQPNENPRRGLKREPGTIAIQGHDASTDVLLKSIHIAPIQN